MRMHGELSDEEEAAAAVEPVTLSSPRAAAALLQQGLVVGYALTKKKVKSFLQPKLLALASLLARNGIKFWRPTIAGEVCTPRQLVIMKDPSSIPDAVAKAGLTLPLVAKPLVVDGTSKSHELSLAYVEASLPLLDPPLVLQEFVNHGGILFKVYIVGETIRVVRRFSLPDVNTYDLGNNDGIFRFPRVSCARNNAEDADVDPCIAELPPKPLLEKLGRELRRRLGLRLFNIDMIREHGRKDRYYVIDINYFPGNVLLLIMVFPDCCYLNPAGYGKMPGYEHIFTDFLLSLVQSKYKRRLSGS
ncbi:hypothetical protein PR202_gb07622 [Eleusine coracana subsp. coracana]|uniref:Inositol-tetrakisphosphate 1-kinase n=1 Tax=Eleusine coracana subsp. coracana TaxID=191504 RepID=A0AAV5EBV9_ELECO|nr:hypothetical protein PR202_gb07622 [Eleusine coracana subsp. coracana]